MRKLVWATSVAFILSTTAWAEDDDAPTVLESNGHMPEAIASNEIQVPGPEGPLRGTMVNPGSGAPMVLIIPGSGPTDRDGNNPLGSQAAPYRLLAEELSGRGIGSVRIDKRGMYGSAEAIADGNNVTIDEYAVDVRDWVAAIQQETDTSCVWVLGHSEGGLVALAAAQENASICGVILVTTIGRPMGDVLMTQLRANLKDSGEVAQAEAVVDRLTAGQRVDPADLPPSLAVMFGPQVQGYLINAFSYDPADLASSLDLPILLLHGGRDLHVQSQDVELLQRAAPQASVRLFPDMNHVLKDVHSDSFEDNIAAYSDPELPLSPGVTDAIADFVRSSN